MLNSITGTVLGCEDQRIIISLGPLSLTVQIPAQGDLRVGEVATLHMYLHWNQENGPSLFGFATELERTVFLLVISCSGLGPKIGLAVLADLGPKAFLDAIQTGNESVLSNVSGIGGKKAEQLVVQLRHKVAKLLKSGIDLGSGGAAQQWGNVSQVLESLNYSRSEINHAMKHLGDTFSGQNLPFDLLMRHALSFLSKRT